MSLKVVGQSGGPTELRADDDKFGVMTQVPEGAVHHSPGGLTNASGNTNFGTPFSLACYFTTSNPSAGDVELTNTLCNSDAPYKLRVLRATVTMVDEANGRLREAANSCSVAVLAGSDSVAAGDVSNLRQLEAQNLKLSRTGGEVVSSSGSLSVRVALRMGETGVTDTLSLLVELTCVRVI